MGLPLELVADGNPEVWKTINLQHARISRAWLPPLSFRNMVYREQSIVNRLRRSTNRGKFSRAAWEFVVVLNSRQYEIPEQKLIQIYHNASIFTQTCAYVRQI